MYECIVLLLLKSTLSTYTQANTHTSRPEASCQVFKTSFRKNKVSRIRARSLVWFARRKKEKKQVNNQQKLLFSLRSYSQSVSAAICSPPTSLRPHVSFDSFSSFLSCPHLSPKILCFFLSSLAPIILFHIMPPHSSPPLPHYLPPSLSSYFSSSFPGSRVCF